MNLSISRIEELFAKASFSVEVIPSQRLLSVIDDDWYENYEYDIVSKSQRDLMNAFLLKRGFKQKSGRVFLQEELGLIIEYAKPTGTLGANPADETLQVVKKNSSWTICTPTQAVLVLISKMTAETQMQTLKQIQELVQKQSANLDKIGDWVAEYGHEKFYRENKSELLRLQKEAMLKRRKAP